MYVRSELRKTEPLLVTEGKISKKYTGRIEKEEKIRKEERGRGKRKKKRGGKRERKERKREREGKERGTLPGSLTVDTPPPMPPVSAGSPPAKHLPLSLLLHQGECRAQ